MNLRMEIGTNFCWVRFRFLLFCRKINERSDVLFTRIYYACEKD
jgi:hypothetical protein